MACAKTNFLLIAVLVLCTIMCGTEAFYAYSPYYSSYGYGYPSTYSSYGYPSYGYGNYYGYGLGSYGYYGKREAGFGPAAPAN